MNYAAAITRNIIVNISVESTKAKANGKNRKQNAQTQYLY